jgi:predicted esterase
MLSNLGFWRGWGSAQVMLLTILMGTVAPEQSIGQAPAGRLEERVTSAADTTQHYALYLPPGYSQDRTWPILFVLDPRGRAVSALRLFQPAAEQLRWLIMSSYNSRSDSLPDANENAMEAMLISAQERLSIDRSRLYLAGFSGTARALLGFAVPLRGHIAGLIAVGGAPGFEPSGPDTLFAGDSTFAFFGAAGTHDFNYEEVLAMAGRFDSMNVPFRVAVFDGDHSWPPADVCGEALQWLELRAMRAGRRTIDSSWVRIRLQSELARAEKLRTLGYWEDALRLYEAVTRDYLPSPATSRAAERAVTLRKSDAVKRYRSEARKLTREYLEQARETEKTLAWARSLSAPPAPDKLIGKLEIAKLRKIASRGDSLRAANAERLLARMFALLAFYEPRSYLAQQSPARALLMLEAATKIAPLQGESCTFLKEARRTGSAPPGAGLAGQCTSAGDSP